MMNPEKARFFDAQANSEWAAAEYGAEEMAKVRRIVESVPIRKGMRIVEPGCGTGRLTELLAEQVGAQGMVTALDISSKMVEKCRERVRGLANVEVFCAALEELPLTGGHYDAVVCHQVFPHFDDKENVLQVIRQLLKPEGVMVIDHFIDSSQINDHHRKAGTVVEHDQIPPREELERLLLGAGFTIEHFSDDEAGYLLFARKGRPAGPR